VPKFLIVSATAFEIKGIIDHYNIKIDKEPGLFLSETVSALITGVGMVNTAYYMGK
jgi:hypothetical protein